MKIEKTEIEGLLIIEPDILTDDRGYFFESYNVKKFLKLGVNNSFVQDNQAESDYGVIRGLHYQLAPFAQSKLMRVLKGKIFDVAVDIRKNSPTFGHWFGIELSDDNQKQFLIPKGFAHGYSVLENNTVVMYKCDEYYNKQSERGIFYNDKSLNIDWRIESEKVIISAKDKVLPELKSADMNFFFNS